MLVRIYFTQKPLREVHFHLLDVCKDRSASLQLQADWATRGWTEVIAKILTVPFNEECLQYLNFDPEHGGASVQDASTFLRLCIRTASARAWSMSIWSELPPFKWAGILHQDSHVRNLALVSMAYDWEVVQRAQTHVQQNGPEKQA